MKNPLFHAFMINDEKIKKKECACNLNENFKNASKFNVALTLFELSELTSCVIK